jgi:hypothetical protein
MNRWPIINLSILLITACTPTLYFQQQSPPQGEVTVELTALFEGNLVLENSCFKVVDDLGESYLIDILRNYRSTELTPKSNEQ